MESFDFLSESVLDADVIIAPSVVSDGLMLSSGYALFSKCSLKTMSFAEYFTWTITVRT